MPKVLRGGTFNLLYGRDPKRVLAEVGRLFAKHSLDFLAVQEFSDYRNAFRDLAGLKVVPTMGACESGLIVRSGVAVDKRTVHVYGDGWITVRGGRFPAATQNEARLNGWLYVRSVHLPTPTFWPDGRLQTPAERRDDLIATIAGLKRYFSHSSLVNARLAAGDWNEAPTTTGQWTPHWLAEQTGATIKVPTSLAGHGHIDYAMVRGARVQGIFKDTAIPELSDHEPVIFQVVKGR